MGDAGRESEPGVRSDAPHRLDRLIAAAAARQHGVLTLAQLTALGLGARAVQKRAASGRLHRVHQGVYALAPPELLTRDGRFMAAVLACGPGAVLSHRSAAELHGLRATDRAAIDVTVPRRSTHRLEGIEVHRSLTLAAADTMTVNGIPCTTVARTMLDLAGVVRRRQLERTMDQAEVLRVLDAGALDAQVERNGKRAAARSLRVVLEEHNAGSTLTDRELEERFLALCRAAGLPQPEVNVWIVPPDNEPAMRVDFVWRAQRLGIETDSHRYHHTRRAFEVDRRRDQRLTLAGWRVVRVTWRQITDQPATITRLVAGLLAQAPAGPQA